MSKNGPHQGTRLSGVPLEAADLIEVKCLCGKVHRFSKVFVGRMATCPATERRFRIPAQNGLIIRAQSTPSLHPTACTFSVQHERQAAIEIVARISRLDFLMYLCRPTIRVDGRVHHAPWGRRWRVSVSAGMHRVEVSFSHPLGRNAGRKQTYISVSRGQLRRLEYRPPQLSFMRGSFRELPLRR